MKPLNEFLSFQNDDIKGNRYRQTFACVDFFLHLTRTLRPEIKETPQIFIRELHDSNEIAAETIYGAIILNQKLIDTLIAIEPFSLEELDIKISDESLIYYGFSEMMLLWIISHEWFHIEKQHRIAESLITNSDDLSLAFEFDADCNASAVIYRFLQYCLELDNEDLEIRKFCFSCVFLLLRNLPHSNRDVTHPPLDRRLFNCLLKICHLSSDLTYTDKKGTRPETKFFEGHLLKLLAKCEQKFIKVPLEELNTSPLFKAFKQSINTNSISKDVGKWEEIRILMYDLTGVGEQVIDE
ncbi:hypothetical protein [Methylobacillus glycogenes]|uniref:hypothetical protein n=1 Tax=Methylobacillus glycogenes TaxID=406 RepID=UPI000471254E|nr:hypothetical protein [Methylobacillus glycogenes]